MAQPFVISMRIDGDASGAVAATAASRQAVTALGRDTEIARTKVIELQRSLEARTEVQSAATTNVAAYNATIETIRAERELEAARLAAQISQEGRNQSLNRFAELGRSAAAASQALAKAERDLVTADLEVAKASGAVTASETAQARAMDDLRARFSPLYAASRQYEAKVVEIQEAHRLGAISANEMTAALGRERAAYEQLNAVAANDNRNVPGAATAGGQNFATSNVAAQFQDIFVTSQMGMSPLQIALQQGTQLSAVLGNQGAAGAARTLGAALFSVISPVSLLTIGTVALGAVGIQAFLGMMNSADDATSSLEKHNDWLDEILHGYDAAREAAQRASDAALKLPQGVVEADLRASLKEQETAAAALQVRIEGARDALKAFLADAQSPSGPMTLGMDAGAGFDAIVQQAQALRDLGLSTSSTTTELEKALTASRQLYHATNDPAIKNMANEVYGLAVQLKALRAETQSAEAALVSLKNLDIQIKIGVQTDAALKAIQDLKDQTPDLRSARDKALDSLNEAKGSAPDGIIRQAAELAYRQTIAGLDAQDAQQAADRASKASARAAKQVSEYDQAIQSIRERTSAQELETNVIGLSTFAAEKARQQLELENAAKKDAIGLSPERIKQIGEEAAAYAQTQAAYDKATEAEQAREEARQFAQGNFRSFFVELGSLTEDGQLSWDDWANAGTNALDRIRDRALGMAADGIFDMIFGAITGSVTGGTSGSSSSGIGGFFSSLFGIGKNAKGTDNWRGGLTQIHEEGGEIVDLPSGTRIIPHDVSMAMAANSQNGGGSSAGNVTHNYYTIDAKGSNISRAEFIQILDERDRVNAAKAPDLLYDARYRGNQKVSG